MARRKRASAEQPIGVGLTTKQMKRKKPLSQEYLVDIEPLSDCLLYTSDAADD